MYKKHRRVNAILTFIVIFLAAYIALLPLFPALAFAYKTKRSNPDPYGMLSRVAGATVGENTTNSPASNPAEDRLVIPVAFIDEPIIQGDGLWAIDDGGIWLKRSSTHDPTEIGNTLLLGHRFTYRHPTGPLYSLDKVRVGDPLAVYWKGKELLYKVTEVKTVAASAVEIENNTTERQLTIYTCTPLFTAKNRLVIIAKPIEVDR